ncbi:MAG: tetraacyldisaccharide 4'-kinase [bacterium]|nr:tetraacyldisaccharide 4'-kinase [bacterium]
MTLVPIMKNETLRRQWLDMAYRGRGPLRWAAPLTLPASWLYGAGAKARRSRYERGAAKPERLPAPVVSIGNLTVGGVGKTPFTLFLAAALREMGYRPGVLMRGYRRRSNDSLIVTPESFDPSRSIDYGDEASMIAHIGGVPIGVDANRSRAGARLINECGVDMLLLDDGFQHIQLHRDLDFVLLDGENPFGNGRCLPHGPLREPIEALRGADALIVRGERLQARIDSPASCFSGGLRWTGIVALSAWLARRWDETRSLQALQESDWTLVSGVGDPGRLERQAADYGARLARHVQFADHHWFERDEIEAVLRGAQTNLILMTEKDAARLMSLAGLAQPGMDRIYVIRARWEMNDRAAFLPWFRQRIETRPSRASVD